VKKGVLERVPVGEADTWCSLIVIQKKKNRRARRTVDLARLSKAGRHESHHTRSAAEIAKSVPAGKLKSTLDCVDGYHGVELAKENRHKTTFATKWGLFRYLRLPQGDLSSGDSYTKHTDAILDTCPGKPDVSDSEKIIYDIIQWSDNLEQAFFRICAILSHCNHNGMVFSPEKFEFAKETVEFVGFKITMEGIKPTDKYVEAIRNFHTPTNISEVCGRFRLINQVTYSFVETEHMAPFQSTRFQWNNDLGVAFRRSKDKITELSWMGSPPSTRSSSHASSPTTASKEWDGFCSRRDAPVRRLCQHDMRKAGRELLSDRGRGNGRRQGPPGYYSPIEGEAPAVAKGLQDTKNYRMG
jgi:hypothetical protein